MVFYNSFLIDTKSKCPVGVPFYTLELGGHASHEIVDLMYIKHLRDGLSIFLD